MTNRPTAAMARITATLLLLTACGTRSETSHPDAVNLAQPEAPSSIVSRKKDAPLPASLSRWSARLSHAREAWTVRSLTTTPGEFTGRIGDVAVGMDGRIWVLDVRLNEIRGFDRNGAFLYSFDGRTAGDYAISSPIAIEATPTGDLVLLEQSGDVVSFQLGDDGVRAARRMFRVAGRADGFCVAGSQMFIRAWNERGVVSRIDEGGSVQATFGATYKHESEFVRRKLSTGLIGCLDQPWLIVSILDRVPAVFAHDGTGKLMWATRFAEYQPRLAIEVRKGSRTSLRSASAAIYEAPLSIVPVDRGVLLVQVARRLPGRTVPAAIYSYIFDAASGAGAYVGADLPQIGATAPGRLIGVEHGSIEKLRVFDYAEEE
jgi:hypothetical protein